MTYARGPVDIGTLGIETTGCTFGAFSSSNARNAATDCGQASTRTSSAASIALAKDAEMSGHSALSDSSFALFARSSALGGRRPLTAS